MEISIFNMAAKVYSPLSYISSIVDIDECKMSFLIVRSMERVRKSEDNHSCKRHWILAFLDRNLLPDAETQALESGAQSSNASIKIFNEKDIKTPTKDFHEARILGVGGQGNHRRRDTSKDIDECKNECSFLWEAWNL
ncbi:unnamed protein product [Eruca vesicaria subsp. sativa]|uniref:Uncharacterized protein n=1 Tax=Eruca vesicaria subsp. sativa TaxID=29727 RepID=A0ABC8KCR1_ERUVS|nr:unnamed protein product [Eruca vesicaria subsp. sativa]